MKVQSLFPPKQIKRTGIKPVKTQNRRRREEAFSSEKELRRAFCLQADNGFRRTCALHLW